MSLASGRASIAICDRCNFKYDYRVLRADGNSPGLRVCPECRDPKNPWRLPPLKPDAIALKYPRPDTPLYPFANVTPPPIPPIPPVTTPEWGDVNALWGDFLLWGNGGAPPVPPAPPAMWGNQVLWGNGITLWENL